MGETKIGPRELQLRQLAQMTRAGKNERAPKPALIDSLKAATAEASKKRGKPRGAKKAKRRG